MAEENQDGQEKTEEPTAAASRTAAEEGRILTSKEVMVFTTLAAGLVLLMGLSPFVGQRAGCLGKLFVGSIPVSTLIRSDLVKVRYAFWLVILATIVVGMPLDRCYHPDTGSGWWAEFRGSGDEFQRQQINPIAGLKNIFSMKGTCRAWQVGSEGRPAVRHWRAGHLSQLPELVFMSSSSLSQCVNRAAQLFRRLWEVC